MILQPRDPSNQNLPIYYAGIDGSTEIPDETELAQLLSPVLREQYELLYKELATTAPHPQLIPSIFAVRMMSVAIRTGIAIHREKTASK